MQEPLVMFAILVAGVLVAGPICGIVALVKYRRMKERADEAEDRINALERRVALLDRPQPKEAPSRREILEDLVKAAREEQKVEAAPLESAKETTGAVEEGPSAEPGRKEAGVVPPPIPPPLLPLDLESMYKTKSSPVEAAKKLSLEMTLGTKWINWVGALMVIIGAGYGLKYAYDNSWIGPMGRIAIGTGWGIVALGLGERFRRRNWDVLFQTLTGLGLAIFYLCIFFSFQIYKLSSQNVSFGLAIAVTGLAVTLAVARNAIAIAIIAVIGGFMSPVLVSTGENSPYALFTYIAILDLVALGAAYFRRWRALELLCFLGTALMLVGWYNKFYYSDPTNPLSQMRPALIFISLFYLMFLLIPTIHTLTRGLPESVEGIALVALNAAFSLLMYYRVLYSPYPRMLGFVVVGQAVIMFLLFQVWIKRVGQHNQTSQSLLIIALGLVTVAVPLHVKLYGVPIAWALEGLLMIHVGIRFRNVRPRAIGVFALFLAAYKLFERLPLHSAVFTPVINVPFGSWALVAAAAFCGAWLLHGAVTRHASAAGAGLMDWKEAGAPVGAGEMVVAGVLFLLGFVLACVLLSLEVSAFWTWRGAQGYEVMYPRTQKFSSLVVLWALIAAGTTTILHRMRLLTGTPARGLAWGTYVIAVGVFVVGFMQYDSNSSMPALNGLFPFRLAVPLALWWGAQCMKRSGGLTSDKVLETVGHVMFAVLTWMELDRWGYRGHVVNSRMALSLVSAVWALQAFGLIWIGLATRNKLRRILGFVLFAVVVGKVLLMDTSELEKVYRIVSFVASGLLLLGAGYFYQRYSALLTAEEMEAKE